MSLEHIIGREIIFVTRRAAEGVTNLVLGAQVVNQRMLLPEDLAAHLTDELQAHEQRAQSVKFRSKRRVNTEQFYGQPAGGSLGRFCD